MLFALRSSVQLCEAVCASSASSRIDSTGRLRRVARVNVFVVMKGGLPLWCRELI
jgi:hypothetical protein